MIGTRTVRLTAGQGRAVDVTICAALDPAPGAVAVVFSHGANAAPSRYGALITAWARAGFVVCAPLHCDSEEHPRRVIDDPLAVRRTRLEDFALVAAMLREGSGGMPPMPGYVAAGHSYGALIAQVAGGAVLEAQAGVSDLTPPHAPLCVIALAPPPPMSGLVSVQGWSRCAVPMLCVAGTADEMPGFVDDWRFHLAAFDAAPCGFAMIFHDMDHYFRGAFGRLAPGAGSRESAVAALNAGVAEFMRGWAGGERVSARGWIAGARPGMARLAHCTAASTP